MKAIKAIFQNGQIMLSEPGPDCDGEPLDVLVVFPETDDEKWERILNDPTPRPALNQLVDELLKEIDDGTAQPLDLDKL